MKLGMSPVAFSVTYCAAYVAALATDHPLFLYYPEPRAFAWSWDRLTDAGPGMAWYGLMATAGLVALPVSVLASGRVRWSRLSGALWLVPAWAMIGCVFLMRQFFQA